MAQDGDHSAPRPDPDAVDGDGLPLPDEATRTALRAQAKGEAPSSDDWAHLYVALVWAADLERRGARNPELPAGATAPEQALRAVNSFLARSPMLVHLGALAPLFRLHSGIIDLADGRVPSIFKPVNKRGGSPGARVPPVVVGLAARAMEELIEAGNARIHAARQVARTLQLAGYRKVTPETIANWRDGCNEGPGGRVADDAVKCFRDPLPAEMGDTPVQRATALLKHLKRAQVVLGT